MPTTALLEHKAVRKASFGESSAAASTASSDAASDWGKANSPAATGSGSETGSVLNTSSPKNGTGSRSKASVAKSVLKRQHSNSASPGVNAPRKRARTTALQRQAPAAKNELPLDNGEMASFTSTIYILKLGPEGRQFHAHEYALKRSSKLRDMIKEAKLQKRVSKQSTLTLLPHNDVSFEQLLSYLYKDKFELSKAKATAVARISEIKELFALANFYQLNGLQKQIVQMFSKSKTLGKLSPATFFDWAEDMYHEELDHTNGPFKNYFARVAPTLMRNLNPVALSDICRMVNLGGLFAVELFKASHSSLILYTFIKEEGVSEEDAGADSVVEAQGDNTDASLFVQW
ncbi:hypothetical protein ACLMJK_001113 [Lecanora helva]